MFLKMALMRKKMRFQCLPMIIFLYRMLANLLLLNAFFNAGSLYNIYFFFINYFAFDVCNIIIYIMVFTMRCLWVIDTYFSGIASHNVQCSLTKWIFQCCEQNKYF